MQAEIHSGQTIAQRVINLREARGWTKGQLATYAKVSPSYVTRLEAGDIPSPSGTMLSKIARALRVSVDDILRQNERIQRPRTLKEILHELEATTPILVPETTQPASAGAGTEVEAEMWPYLPEANERGHRFIAVPVSGDCMEPQIREGHRVIVDLDASPHPGDIVLAIHEGESLVKTLEKRNGELYLVALKRRPPLKVNESTRILGVVKTASYRPLAH